MTKAKYRVVGTRGGKTRKEVIDAADDSGALAGAQSLCEKRGMTFDRLFHLERRHAPREILVAA